MSSRITATIAMAGWMRRIQSAGAASVAAGATDRGVVLSTTAMVQRLANRPWGRTASTATMIRKVSTTE